MASNVELDPHDWTTVRGELRSYIQRRVESADAAEDITQDVIERMHRVDLSNIANLYAWMYRAAQNAIVDHYRSRKPALEFDAEAVSTGYEPVAHDEPAQAFQELARCLRPLIEHLPPPYREAVVAVDLNGRTHRDFASDHGLSVSGMKSRVQRGRRQLGELLNQCCDIQRSADGAISYRPQATEACDCAPPDGDHPTA